MNTADQHGHHPSTFSADQLLQQCLVRRTRHSGPGGQHRNKVETAIEIVHEPTGIVSFAAERRSQDANRQTAIFRLRVLLAIRFRNVSSSDVQPSALWVSRCRSQKIQCNDRHPDFPAMLAEAMNAIHAKDYDVSKAAGALGCTMSQLVRFVGGTPEAFEVVNSQRELRQLHRLKL
ncbi:MAG: peptide chain release factor-like protein [Planctomyces sp.]|nr:peptide chain release factor-like protein [Planctomyces sp.]